MRFAPKFALLKIDKCAAPYTSVGECVKQTFRYSGVRGPFQGLFTTMVRNVPANSVYLGSFEVLKTMAADYKKCSVPELPAQYVLGSAGAGGILYWCCIYPVDVCKSAIMTVNHPACQNSRTALQL